MLRTRVLTAILLIPIALLVILLPTTAIFPIVLAPVFVLGAWEWTRLCGLQRSWSRAAAILAMLIIMLALWYARDQRAIWDLTIALGVAWWIVSLRWLRGYSFGAAPGAENRTLKLIAGGFIFVPAWIALITIHGMQPYGPWWTLFAVVIVWFADTGAYFSGRFFGRRKLAPRISPGKTWAGAYGAVVFGGLFAGLGGWALGTHGWALAGLVVLGVVTVMASIIGDLFESLMKRHADTKDSGSLFPGHGGLLDRMDSVFAAMPIFAAGMLLLHP